MEQSLLILGRQPALGLAELQSLYGDDKVSPIGRSAALVDLPPSEIQFMRLGGSLKLAKFLDKINSTNWSNIEDYLKVHLPKHICCIPEGKLVLGISVYDLNVKVNEINKTGLNLKKLILADGRPARIVPNKTPDLSSAQVLHNKLFTTHNWELLLVNHGGQTYLAQTTNVQAINAYAARDQVRPKRDPRVGMLPPKLAQIIINLAVDQRSVKSILDPFCGTGVILQEALLMGYSAVGSDIEPRMIEYSKANLEWLADKWEIKTGWQLHTGDACKMKWDPNFDTVAGEAYLGRPFSSLPTPAVLNQVIQDVDTIHKKFLENVARQTKPGFRMAIAVPAWKTKNGFKHLPTLEKLEELGYTWAVFKHISNNDLIYHRESQIVGRELAVLIRM
jgi:SAM-dependent methyltransferase